MFTKAELTAIDDRIELGVRRYFDHYLSEVFPSQMEAHNKSVEAHGGIVAKFSRFKWAIIGVGTAGGFATGAGAERLFNMLG